MDGLKVGNHTQTDSTTYVDIDLSGDSPDTTIEQDVPNEPVVTEPEVIVDQQNDEPETLDAEPAKPEPAPIDIDSLADTPVQTSGDEIDETRTLEYLSEKLGRNISSMDDLIQPEVKNPLDDDPYLKKIHEWRTKTGRPIEDWIKYQKDYSKLSDLDVAREYLQHEYPTFTKAEIEEELKEFQRDDMDDDSDASKKERKLKKYSTKGRSVLGELVSELGDVSPNNLPPEVQQDLELAKQYKENYSANQKAIKDYNDGIIKTSQSTDTLTLSLSDDFSIDYKIPNETKKGLPDLINQMPHWKNQDGSWNHQAVVNDAIKLKHHTDMLRLAYEQGVNAGSDKVVQQANNITLAQPNPMEGNDTGKKGIEIEGFDDFVGSSGMKLRFKK